LSTPEDPNYRPPLPRGGGCYFWALDTRRWVECTPDDPRGIAGEGYEFPENDPGTKQL
jgi:hypothetical protein